MRNIDTIFIHCADTPANMDIGVVEIKQWHTVERGWSDIGYHYVIRRDGTVEEGRPEEVAGAGVKGHNKNSIHVCLVGGKPDANFTMAQYRSMNGLCEQLETKYPGVEIMGHRDAPGVTKTCPNFDVKSLLKFR